MRAQQDNLSLAIFLYLLTGYRRVQGFQPPRDLSEYLSENLLERTTTSYSNDNQSFEFGTVREVESLSGFAYGRSKASSDSEQIEQTIP